METGASEGGGGGERVLGTEEASGMGAGRER